MLPDFKVCKGDRWAQVFDSKLFVLAGSSQTLLPVQVLCRGFMPPNAWVAPQTDQLRMSGGGSQAEALFFEDF